jgi:hypothetical protein
MAEPVQPTNDPPEGWTASQVKALVDEKIASVQRAVDVAREGVPPHVTIQEHFESLEKLRHRYEDKLEVEKEKGIQLALTAANELEQERIARAADQTECERRVGDLRAELQAMAINKAESSQKEQFKALEDQISTLRTAFQELTRRLDKLA